jgi:glucose-6-phosphate 1-dehydrogenase
MSNEPLTPEVAPAATLVIFGAMGDLARRLLVPAIFNLARDGLIPDAFAVLGVSHHDATDEDLRASLEGFIPEDERGGDAWRTLRGRIGYLRGDFTEASTYTELAAKLKGNAVFYLATAPEFFGPVVEQLAKAGALEEKDDAFRRVLVEKPFGHDLASARALNAQILAQIPESQIYRVDHFLGKETVQNIMVARFGNHLFEAIWNNRYIDHVQITAAETVAIDTRGKFYDATGALRDMVPNHLFQLLAMVAMEPPNSFDAEAVRNEKAKVLSAVRGPRPGEVDVDAVRGRYVAGKAGDKDVRDYLSEADVAPDSRTETYAAVKVEIESWRWVGVPFYLRTGKAMSVRDTEIVLQFKPVAFALFRDTDVDRLPPNRLVIQIQPHEGMSLKFLVKKPGPLVDTAEVSMDFAYADAFTMGQRTGYETLLYDAFIGDQTLFQRADMIEAGWAAMEPVLEAWQAGGAPEDYVAGTDGPDAAARLLERDGRHWNPLG